MWRPFKARREKKEEARRVAEHNAMTWFAPAAAGLRQYGGWNLRGSTQTPSVVLINPLGKPYGPLRKG